MMSGGMSGAMSLSGFEAGGAEIAQVLMGKMT